MYMENFLEETLRCLNGYGKTEKDILWVGRGFAYDSEYMGQRKYWSTWEDFKSKADFCYDGDYGIVCIPLDLIMAGKDFWLEREEYDGQEKWAYRTMPIKPSMKGELDLSDAWEAAEWMRESEEELCRLPETDMEWQSLFWEL